MVVFRKLAVENLPSKKQDEKDQNKKVDSAPSSFFAEVTAATIDGGFADAKSCSSSSSSSSSDETDDDDTPRFSDSSGD